jgi:hypothetical protein
VSKVAGGMVSAFQVNECFIPGRKNYEVDYTKLSRLGE